MYLIERIIGIGVFVFFLFLFTFIIKKSKPNKVKEILFLYSIILAIIAFCFSPSKTDDLYRINESMEIYYKNMDISTLKEWVSRSTTPVSDLYFFLFSKIGIKGLISAVTAFIFYRNVFYIIYKSAIKFNIDSRIVASGLFFVMISGQYIEVISGIRSMLAFSIVARCCFEEMIEGKSLLKNIILYILASFLHPAALLLTVIRFVFLLIQFEKNNNKRIRNCIVLFAIIPIGWMVGKEYIFSASEKALSYLSGQVYSYVWEYIIAGINVIYVIICIYMFSKILKEYKDEGLQKMFKFVKFITLIDVLFSFEYSIFHRYRTFLIIIFIPIYLVLLQKIRESECKYKYRQFNMISVMCTMAIFILVCTRGNLTALKFFINI